MDGNVNELKSRCFISTNSEGDDFVGIRADSSGAYIYFPQGYHLAENDLDIRQDINNLLSVLCDFLKEELVLEAPNKITEKSVIFPIHAYMYVARDFLTRGSYYIEKEQHYNVSNKGKIVWSKTLKNRKGLLQQNGSLVFSDFIVKENQPNFNKAITQINRFCVYEAFSKIGWLYVPFMPEACFVHPSLKESISIIRKKILQTFNDDDRRLFNSMLSILLFLDRGSSDKTMYYGTTHFDKIWEKMIDQAFGIKGKDAFFPHAYWLLDNGDSKLKAPLQPDSIMIYKDKIYVIDAKYYRYGCTGNPEHLPNSSDINKQITYGEYIETKKNISNDSLYNCFIMPFDKRNNIFGLDSNIGNVAEAFGEWRDRGHCFKNYERIQGIVMDTRFLMHNYMISSSKYKELLIASINKIHSRKN